MTASTVCVAHFMKNFSNELARWKIWSNEIHVGDSDQKTILQQKVTPLLLVEPRAPLTSAGRKKSIKVENFLNFLSKNFKTN